MEKISDNNKSQRGAQYLEYVIALSILLVVFVIAGKILTEAGRNRGNASMNAVQSMVPCAPGMPLSGVGGDACK